MNLRIATYVSFDGDVEDIKLLIQDFADVLARHGFATPAESLSEEDPILHSIIIARDFGDDFENDDAGEFISDEMNLDNSMPGRTVIVTMPIKPEETDDDRESRVGGCSADGEDQCACRRQDQPG